MEMKAHQDIGLVFKIRKNQETASLGNIENIKQYFFRSNHHHTPSR